MSLSDRQRNFWFMRSERRVFLKSLAGQIDVIVRELKYLRDRAAQFTTQGDLLWAEKENPAVCARTRALVKKLC